MRFRFTRYSSKQRFVLHNDERPRLPIHGAGRLNRGAIHRLSSEFVHGTPRVNSLHDIHCALPIAECLDRLWAIAVRIAAGAIGALTVINQLLPTIRHLLHIPNSQAFLFQRRRLKGRPNVRSGVTACERLATNIFCPECPRQLLEAIHAGTYVQRHERKCTVSFDRVLGEPATGKICTTNVGPDRRFGNLNSI